jgi:hypothetical protein
MVFLGDIARVLYTTLLFSRKLYNRFGYSGLTQGAVQLTGAKGRPVLPNMTGKHYWDDYPLAVDAMYHWPIEADTHQLSDDGWVHDYFCRTMQEIYWDLGFRDVPESIYDEFLTVWQFA